MERKLDEIYKEFGVMLTEDKIYQDPMVRYEDICRELGVLPSELDSLLLRELGYTGEEIMAEYRSAEQI